MHGQPNLKITNLIVKYRHVLLRRLKRLNYDTQIKNLNDTIKTTWEIVKLKMGGRANNGNIHPFNVASRMVNNQQNIADTLHNNFLSIDENIDVN
jgi:hypothetical protein